MIASRRSRRRRLQCGTDPSPATLADPGLSKTKVPQPRRADTSQPIGVVVAAERAAPPAGSRYCRCGPAAAAVPVGREGRERHHHGADPGAAASQPRGGAVRVERPAGALARAEGDEPACQLGRPVGGIAGSWAVVVTDQQRMLTHRRLPDDSRRPTVSGCSADTVDCGLDEILAHGGQVRLAGGVCGDGVDVTAISTGNLMRPSSRFRRYSFQTLRWMPLRAIRPSRPGLASQASARRPPPHRRRPDGTQCRADVVGRGTRNRPDDGLIGAAITTGSRRRRCGRSVVRTQSAADRPSGFDPSRPGWLLGRPLVRTPPAAAPRAGPYASPGLADQYRRWSASVHPDAAAEFVCRIEVEPGARISR